MIASHKTLYGFCGRSLRRVWGKSPPPPGQSRASSSRGSKLRDLGFLGVLCFGFSLGLEELRLFLAATALPWFKRWSTVRVRRSESDSTSESTSEIERQAEVEIELERETEREIEIEREPTGSCSQRQSERERERERENEGEPTHT